eukprot:gene7579-7642_t
MTNTSETIGQNYRNHNPACGRNPFEIAAIILGFIVFWPIGLALLFWRLGRDRSWSFRHQWGGNAMNGGSYGWSSASKWGGACWNRSSFGPINFRHSGNSAFDDWKSAELARLEEERRKLDEAQRAFADHLENLRRARDRAEFESFMAAWQNKSGQ